MLNLLKKMYNTEVDKLPIKPKIKKYDYMYIDFKLDDKLMET